MKTISIFYNTGNISSANMAYLRCMDGVWQWIPAPVSQRVRFWSRCKARMGYQS